MRLLLANPNTTQAVTDWATARARAVARPDTEVVAVTARFGARIIGTRAELAVAEHAALDLIAREAPGMDAVVVAASTDSGVRAARDLLQIPVVGLTEASLHVACLTGTWFGTVTLSRRSNEILHDQIDAAGLASRCRASRFVEATPQDVVADAAGVAGLVAAEIARVVDAGAEAVVLVGAVMAAFVDVACPVPLLEGVSCAVAMAEALVRLPRVVHSRYAATRETVGLDPALAGLLGGIA